MKQPDMKLIIAYILFIMLMIVCFLFGSCRTVKEVTRTEKVYDSTAISERDSIIAVKQERITRLENEIKESQYSGVTFEPIGGPDSLWGRNNKGELSWFPIEPNKVEIKPDGSIIASGKIKSAVLSKERAERNYAELKQSYDSLAAAKQKEVVQVQWKEKIVEKEVKRGVPWFWFALCFAAGCIFWNYIGSKIKFFIQKLFK